MRYYDYFHSGESDRFAFFRMPKILFTDPKFNKISTDSKVLYGLLLDRMDMSRRNGWVDEEDRVYIIFTVEEMAEILNRSESYVYKILSELDTSEEGIGLIERKRQGQGYPNIIYVKKFYEDYLRPLQNGGQDLHEKEIKTSTEKRSRPPQNGGQDLHEKHPNNTNNSNTDKNKTDRTSYSDSASVYGSFHNVHLMKQELDELKKMYLYDWEYWIESLSKYMASTGRTYQNHFATICMWADKEKPKKKKRNYSFPEGASL